MLTFESKSHKINCIQIENLRSAVEKNKVDLSRIDMLEKLVDYCEERIEILNANYEDPVIEEPSFAVPVYIYTHICRTLSTQDS